ncbi:MAG: hypothetical protein ABIH74_05600 [Candidatus Omnitrophota bacterium]
MAKKIIIIIMTGLCLSVFVSSEASPEDLKPKSWFKRLKGFAKSRKAMVEELAGETAGYKKISGAINENQLQKGKTASYIETKYGKPVVILPEEEGAFAKWVYKPSNASFFSGEKAYLFFDKDDKLTGWQLLCSKEKTQEQ